MKKTVVIVMFLLLVSTQAVRAEMGPGEKGAEPQVTAENLPQAKERLLKRIEHRIERLQNEKACVSAAATPDALRKCRPEHPGMRKKGE